MEAATAAAPHQWGHETGTSPTWSPARPDPLSLIGYAVLAPSAHNAQPWRFRVTNDAIELLADRSRALPVADPDDRALTIGCAASLFYLRLACRRAGYAERATLIPDPTNRDLLARLHLSARAEPTPDDGRLFNAIPRRRTNRRAFADRPVPPALVAELLHDAAAERCRPRIVAGDAARAAVAALVEEADRRQEADVRFRRELATWIHRPHSPRRDGLPNEALAETGLLSYVDRSDDTRAARLSASGPDRATQRARAVRDLRVVTGSPLVVLLATAGDEPRDWLAAGQALARLLLQAAAAGVSASFLNQPIEVADMRPRLARVLDEPGYPQLLLRLGYGPEVPPTPRRPVADVLVGHPEERP